MAKGWSSLGMASPGSGLSNAATFNQVYTDVKAARPVAARIGWTSGGGHMNVVYGFDTSNNTIGVADPWPDTAAYTWWDYNDYVSNSSFKWTHSRIGISRQGGRHAQSKNVRQGGPGLPDPPPGRRPGPGCVRTPVRRRSRPGGRPHGPAPRGHPGLPGRPRPGEVGRCPQRRLPIPERSGAPGRRPRNCADDPRDGRSVRGRAGFTVNDPLALNEITPASPPERPSRFLPKQSG